MIAAYIKSWPDIKVSLSEWRNCCILIAQYFILLRQASNNPTTINSQWKFLVIVKVISRNGNDRN